MNQTIETLKESLGFGVLFTGALLMLSVYARLFFIDYIILSEPNKLILGIETTASLFGIYFGWKYWKKNIMRDKNG